ncbi:MAG: hypothetical protein ABIZ35_15680 [Capsulimonas sp.]|uniref:hypothetical protein n=1 Tax=Capsulimonas sp. TaxID=2494211 RepID=UPI003265C863
MMVSDLRRPRRGGRRWAGQVVKEWPSLAIEFFEAVHVHGRDASRGAVHLHLTMAVSSVDGGKIPPLKSIRRRMHIALNRELSRLLGMSPRDRYRGENSLAFVHLALCHDAPGWAAYSAIASGKPWQDWQLPPRFRRLTRSKRFNAPVNFARSFDEYKIPVLIATNAIQTKENEMTTIKTATVQDQDDIRAAAIADRERQGAPAPTPTIPPPPVPTPPETDLVKLVEAVRVAEGAFNNLELERLNLPAYRREAADAGDTVAMARLQVRERNIGGEVASAQKSLSAARLALSEFVKSNPGIGTAPDTAPLPLAVSGDADDHELEKMKVAVSAAEAAHTALVAERSALPAQASEALRDGDVSALTRLEMRRQTIGSEIVVAEIVLLARREDLYTCIAEKASERLGSSAGRLANLAQAVAEATEELSQARMDQGEIEATVHTHRAWASQSRSRRLQIEAERSEAIKKRFAFGG